MKRGKKELKVQKRTIEDLYELVNSFRSNTNLNFLEQRKKYEETTLEIHEKINQLIDLVDSLAISSAQNFEKQDIRFNLFKEEIRENFEIIKSKLSQLVLDEENTRNQVEKHKDKVNNVFFLGKEVRDLEKRIKKLEEKK